MSNSLKDRQGKRRNTCAKSQTLGKHGVFEDVHFRGLEVVSMEEQQGVAQGVTSRELLFQWGNH